VALAVGAGYWIILISAFLFWPLRGNEVVGEDQDPILGLVTRKRSSWEAKFDYSTRNPEDYDDFLTVTGGEAPAPTVTQLATFVEIKDGWGQWVEKLNEALDHHPSKLVSALPREVYFSKIKLHADDMAWSLEFFIVRENVEADLDLDLVVHFKNGKLEDVFLLPSSGP